MSGKRAKPKGAAATPPSGHAPVPSKHAAPPATSSPVSASATAPGSAAAADAGSTAGTATGLLERPVQTSATAVLPAGAQTGARNAARAERRRRERRRRLAVSAGAVVVVLALVVAYVIGRSPAAEQPGAVTPGRTQSTVLLKIGDPVVTGMALLAADPTTGDGAVVLIPSKLVVDVAGFGPMTLAEAASLPDPARAANALADTLGITVDGTWQLSSEALAALVDAAGGVTVDVDTDVTGPGQNGSQVILIPAGTQTLDGASAAVYAAFLGKGEPEESRLARLDAVLSAALGGLSTDAGQVTLALGSLGAGSVSNVPDSLPGTLAALRSAEGATSVVHRTLPVSIIDAGDSQPSVAVDAKSTAALVDDLLAGSKAASRPGGDVRVLVQNGVGTPGLGSSARDRLVADGFTYVAGGNAARFGTPNSLVLITASTAEKRAEGAAIAAALGLPDSAVRLTSQGQSVADVVVILGKDYHPKKAP